MHGPLRLFGPFRTDPVNLLYVSLNPIKVELIIGHKQKLAYRLTLTGRAIVVNTVTHKVVRPGARPHVPPVMAEGGFRLMTPLYDNLQ